MKLFILAAGRGKRLKSLTENLPKPLIAINNKGTSILEYNLNHAIKSNCFEEIIIITGYKSHMIEECVRKINSTRIKCLYNNSYNFYGPIGSLSKINNQILTNNCVIINGDTLYESIFFEHIKKHNKTGLYYSRKRTYLEDEVKLSLCNKQIKQISKNLPLEKVEGVSSGFVILRDLSVRKLFNKYIYQMDSTNEIWHEVINMLVKHDVQFNALEIEEEYWHEIDTIQDYNRYHLLKG
ncbi:nucleotidyl transferase [Bacillus sp. TS-2]|nr:nucleotidyl transferase [Bacillus sp. TS-2]